MARSPSREIQSQVAAHVAGRASRSPSSASAQPLGGVEAGLDPLGELDLLLGVEQRDLADLLEVGPDRVGGGGQLGVPAGLLEGLGLLVVPLEVGRSAWRRRPRPPGPARPAPRRRRPRSRRRAPPGRAPRAGSSPSPACPWPAALAALAGARRPPWRPSAVALAAFAGGAPRRPGGRPCAAAALRAAAAAPVRPSPRRRRRACFGAGAAAFVAWCVALAVVALDAGVADAGGGDPAAGARRAVDHDGHARLGERAQDLLGLGRSHLGGLDGARDLGRRELAAGALRVGDQRVGERANVGAGLAGFCHE